MKRGPDRRRPASAPEPAAKAGRARRAAPASGSSAKARRGPRAGPAVVPAAAPAGLRPPPPAAPPRAERALAPSGAVADGARPPAEPNRIVHADNLEHLRTLPAGVAALVYIDPPFNTGKRQERRSVRSVRDEQGDHVGFHGRRYRTIELGRSGYRDDFDDFLAFLAPRFEEARRILRPDGSFFLHIDYREAHYCKVLLDQVFGRDRFLNEIVWAYDYGARTRKRWPTKHDTLFWYAMDPSDYVFDVEAVDRIPYMAPGLVGAEKAARGKTPTDVWWHTIVSPNGREKTGYATQKPLGILERIVKVHTRPGDLVVDFFAGSGTTGEAAAKHGRRFLLVDDNSEAIAVMERRLARFALEVVRPAGVRAARARSGGGAAGRAAGSAGAP